MNKIFLSKRTLFVGIIFLSIITFDGVLMAQDFFWLAPYSAKKNSTGIGGSITETIRDNFNVGGLTYATTTYNDEIKLYTNAGIPIVKRMWPTRTVTDAASTKYHGEVGTRVYVANVNSKGDDEVADASDDQINIWIKQIEDEIKATVANSVLNNSLIAWYLLPEEVRAWKPQELKLLKGMYDAVKMYDPQKRPAWMYNPQHSDSKRLLDLKDCLDYWTIGAYPHGWDNDHKRLQIKHAVTQMVNANNSLTTPKPIFPALEMWEDNTKPYSSQEAVLIPKFVRHDAYAAVANGANGILIWSMGNRSGFTYYTTYYNAWAKFSKETYEFGLREVFNKGTVQNRATYDITTGDKSIAFYINSTYYNYSPISLREWDYNGETYVLIVNSADNSIQVDIKNLKANASNSYWEIFDGTEYKPVSGTLSFNMPAYQVIFLCTKIITTSVEDSDKLPTQFVLQQNYPNPFNPETVIKYQIATGDFVSLKVYDVLGREVATLVNEYKQAGSYSVMFRIADAKSTIYNLHSTFSSGVYYYKLQAGNYSETKKMLLLK